MFVFYYTLVILLCSLLFLILYWLLFDFYISYYVNTLTTKFIFLFSQVLGIVLIFLVFGYQIQDFILIFFKTNNLPQISCSSNSFLFFFTLLVLFFLFLIHIWRNAVSYEKTEKYCLLILFILFFGVLLCYNLIIFLIVETEIIPLYIFFLLYITCILFGFYVLLVLKLVLSWVTSEIILLVLVVSQILDVYYNVNLILQFKSTVHLFEILLIFILFQLIFCIFFFFLCKEENRLLYLEIACMLGLLFLRCYYIYCIQTFQPYFLCYEDIYVLIQSPLEFRVNYINNLLEFFSHVYDVNATMSYEKILQIVQKEYNLDVIMERCWYDGLCKLVSYEKHRFIVYRFLSFFFYL